MTNSDVTVEDRRPDALEACRSGSRRHRSSRGGQSRPDDRGAFRGLPFLTVAPRPGSQPTRVGVVVLGRCRVGTGSPRFVADFDGFDVDPGRRRPLPTDRAGRGASPRRRSARPRAWSDALSSRSSRDHEDRGGRARAHRWRGSRRPATASSVVGRARPGSSGRGSPEAIRSPRSPRSRRPVEDDIDRDRRRDRAAQPTDQRRPAAPRRARREIAKSRFVPSTSSHSVSASGSVAGGRFDIGPSYAGPPDRNGSRPAATDRTARDIGSDGSRPRRYPPG